MKHTLNAKELRIGNLIQDHNGNVLTVYGVAMQERGDYVIWYDKEGGFYLDEHECAPIPLTPELLEKCGFTLDKDDDGVAGYKRTGQGRLSIFLDRRTYTDNTYDWGLQIEFNVGMGYNQHVLFHMNHLHELQNLYFSLTGEELPTNL